MADEIRLYVLVNLLFAFARCLFFTAASSITDSVLVIELFAWGSNETYTDCSLARFNPINRITTISLLYYNCNEENVTIMTQ